MPLNGNKEHKSKKIRNFFRHFFASIGSFFHSLRYEPRALKLWARLLTFFVCGALTGLIFNSDGWHWTLFFLLTPMFWILFQVNAVADVDIGTKKEIVHFTDSEKFISKHIPKRRAAARRDRFLYMFAFGFGYFPVSLYWLFEFSKILEFSNFQRHLIVVISLVLISVYLSLFWAVPMLIFGGSIKKNVGSVLTISAIFVLGEWLQGLFYPLAFPWARLANVISPFNAFIQSASLFGSLFVSLLVLLGAGFFALAATRFIKSKWLDRYVEGAKTDRVCFCVLGTVLALNVVYGWMILSVKDHEDDIPKAAVLIQGNYPGLMRWDDGVEMFNSYVETTKSVLEGGYEFIDFVVFPEIAIPFDFYKDSEKREILLDICAEYDVQLVMGIYDKRGEQTYNSMISLYPDRTYSETYSKKRLVPFAERVMFAGVINRLFPDLLDNYSVSEGEQDTLFSIKRDGKAIAQIGGMICYENIFPEIARNTTRNGANVIAFITDDGWFGKTAALRQHLSHTKLRAIENNRYILQSSNTGITTTVNNRGQESYSPPINVRSYEISMFFTSGGETLYTKLGDIPILSAILGWLIFELINLKFFKFIKSKKGRTHIKMKKSEGDFHN